MEFPDKEGFLVQVNIQLDIYERNYEKALSRLKNTQQHIVNTQFSFIPADLIKGIINLYLERNEEAKKCFNSAINFLNQKIIESPDDHRLYSSLGIAYAGLNQKEEAIKWAKKGVELLPVSKEALRGQARVNDLAKVYVMIDEYDLAIDLLEELLNIPSEITPSILRIDPMWDKLRGNKKFDKLVSK